MVDVITYWFNFIAKLVESFFLYEIVDGVTWGWFLVACLIFAVFVQFFFRKIVK